LSDVARPILATRTFSETFLSGKFEQELGVSVRSTQFLSLPALHTLKGLRVGRLVLVVVWCFSTEPSLDLVPQVVSSMTTKGVVSSIPTKGMVKIMPTKEARRLTTRGARRLATMETRGSAAPEKPLCEEFPNSLSISSRRREAADHHHRTQASHQQEETSYLREETPRQEEELLSSEEGLRSPRPWIECARLSP
jgi:hypothetical protein